VPYRRCISTLQVFASHALRLRRWLSDIARRSILRGELLNFYGRQGTLKSSKDARACLAPSPTSEAHEAHPLRFDCAIGFAGFNPSRVPSNGWKASGCIWLRASSNRCQTRRADQDSGVLAFRPQSGGAYETRKSQLRRPAVVKKALVA